MRIAAFQGPVAFGDPKTNLETIEQTLAKAEAQDVSIVCFPETFLHGYFREEDQARRNAVRLDDTYFRKLRERLAKYRPVVLFGLNELRDDQLFNTVVVLRQGELLGRYSKNYLVFKYFQRGSEFPVFEHDGVKFGVVICADTSYIEPARILAMKGAQIIFTPHFNYIGYAGLDDHTWRVRQHHIAIAIDNDVYVARSNVTVTAEEGTEVFGYAGVGVGDSLILNRRGRVLTEAGLCRETLLVADLDDRDLKEKRSRPWQRVSPEMATALADEYQQMFATHQHEA